MTVSLLLCAKCGSHHVDVRCWRSRTVAVLRCATCDHEAPVSGFTVGRARLEENSNIVTEAVADAALPHQGVR